jgi:predicted SnoaL-like aldol condensation-catalyzing enzyme
MTDTWALENKRLIAVFVQEIFVKKNLAVLDRFMAEDYIQHNPMAKQGRAGFKKFFAAWFDAVPNWKYTLRKIIAENNEVWVYGTYSGTLKKEWLGIVPSGKKYAFEAVDIFRIQNGKLAEHWDVVDIYTLFRQMGVVAAPSRKAVPGQKAVPSRKATPFRKAA